MCIIDTSTDSLHQFFLFPHLSTTALTHKPRFASAASRNAFPQGLISRQLKGCRRAVPPTAGRKWVETYAHVHAYVSPHFLLGRSSSLPFFFILQKCCTRAENSCSQLPALRFDRWKHAFCLGSAALPAGLDKNTHNAVGCAPCGTRALLMRNKPSRLTGACVPPRIARCKRPGDTTHKSHRQSMI